MVESVRIEARFMDQPYALAGRQIDPVAGLVHWAGQSQHIRRKPLEILALLAQAGTGLVSRETFIDVVWDGNALVGERALNDTVSALRQLLEDKDRHQPLLRTIPRRGYQLAVPVVWEPAVASPSFVPGAGLPALPNHRLIRLLARSGHYDTWLAETTDRGNRLTLRICRSETQLRWLKREVTMLRLLRERLGGRPDLVAIDAWQLDDPPYTLSMRHCAGGDLASWVQERGGWSAIPVALRLRLLAQIAEALGATHQAGLAHGAIQPSAILIDRDANGKEFACLGGWARGNVADRASLVAASITVTGLTANTADAPRAEDDLRAFAELALRICCGQLDGGLPDAAALADAHPDWQELWNDCRTPDGLPPSATTVASRLRELAAAAERSDLSSATATPQRATPPAVAPAVPLPRDPIPTPERTPDRPPVPSGTDEFAPYNVLGNLGEGGMGVVYLAEQPAPLRRKVALKVLRESVPDPQLLARFHAERRTLALMQHPHIAAVYDIGQSATGRPYFVMEYVPGLDIEQYCTQHRLPLADRITLFLQACAGVLHAHQRGVIHRDLKPGNLLVCAQQGQKGAVKIIDFGVAKLLQGPLGSELFQTRIGTTVGTPLYCSPEQLDPAAGDIDTRADIYSLGVVLYQLLVGATPLDRRTISDLTARQLADQLRQRTVPNPAQRFDGLPADLQRDHSAGCGMTPTTLRGILQSDLAWVIGRCLEQDPEDRYASVLDLQRDLERWLAQQPVEARPVTPMYRVRKFYRRHRLQVWSSLAILLLLIATTVSAIIGFVQARQATRTAEQAAAQARLAATFQTAQIRGLDLPGMGLDIRTTLQAQLEAIPLDPGPRARVATALADINYVDLARKQLQRRYLEPAQTVIEHDYADYPGLQADLLLALSASARNLGALDTADAAIQKGEQMAARMTTGRDAMAARIRHEQGLILLARARYAQAEPLLEDAVQTLLRVQSGTDASTLDAMESLVQLRLHRRNPEALPLARQLIGWRHRNTDTPVVRTLQDQRLLGESQVIAGNLPEARQLLESAHAELRRQVPDAVLVRSQIEVALSDLNARDGQRAESVAFSRQALEGFRQALGERHETTLQQMLAVAQDLRRNGELDAAENLGDQIATLVHEVYGSKHPLITEIQHLRGILLYRRGLTLEALDLLQQTREQLRREATGNDYSNPWTVAAIMPDILIDLGRLDEAEALIEELLAQSEGSPVWGLGAISVRQAQARLLRQQGRLPEAVSVLRETLAFAQQREPGNHSILLDLSSQLGGLLHAEGKFQEAERYLLNSLAGQNALEFDRRVRAPLTRARLGALRLSQGNGEEALQLSRQGLSGARLFMHEGDTRWAELWILNARAEIAMGDKEAGKHALSQGLRVARDSQLGRYYHTLLDALCAELWGQGNRGQSDAC